MPRRSRTALEWTATRERLLRAAACALAESGPEGLSIDAVAKQAGVSKGAIQYNLGSKSQLLIELSDWLVRGNFDEGIARDDRDDVARLAEALCHGLSSDGIRFRAVLSLISAAPRAEYAQTSLGAFYRAIDARLVPALAQAGVPESARGTVARLIRSLVLGAHAHWAVYPQGRSPEDVARETVQAATVLAEAYRPEAVGAAAGAGRSAEDEGGA